MEKDKKMKALSLDLTKALILFLGFVAFLAMAGLAESLASGKWFWLAVSILVTVGSVWLIDRISRSKNFKTINRLEGPSSLGEKME